MPERVALRLISVGVGLFFLAMSLNKVAWLADPALLSDRFQRWLPNAEPYAQVYLRTVAIPAAPLFARVVPLAEFLTALAMVTGVGTRMAAALALVMVLNFQVATSSFSSVEILRDGTGPLLWIVLLALATVRGRLPFSVGR